MLQKKILLPCLIFLLFLCGCNPPIYTQTHNNIADVKLRAEAARHKADALIKPLPSLVVNEGLYVDKTPISLTRQPSWLRNKIVLRGGQLPFSYYTRTIALGGGRNILSHYQLGLDQALLLSINYVGTVKGALDLMASKTGFIYFVSGHHIYWQSVITRTFDIAFMPGASDYMMGKDSGGSSPTKITGGGGAGNTIVASGILEDSSAAQYSNLKGNLSVWRDLRDSIQQMLTPDGKVMVSEATTSVTVRDRPSNVALIGRFIANLNNNLSKQVLVKIQVLDVTLESDFNYGINWNVVQRAFGNGYYQLVSDNGTPITIRSVTGLKNNLSQIGLNAPNASATNGVTGITSLINALKQQGKVSVVTEPRVLCQNNQVSVIRLVEQEGYLASVQTTTLAGSATAGGASVTSQITPGTLVTGVTLYVLPKILGNKVYLQVNADLSTNLGIQSISSTGGVIPTSGVTGNASVIQVPRVQQKQFNQRSVISSGDTLVLSGFRQLYNQGGANQLLDSQSLGGKAAMQRNTETIVLITPIVLHG